MNDLMLQVLVIAIVANVVLIVIAIIRSRMQRPKRELAAASATVGAASMAASDGLTPPVAQATGPDLASTLTEDASATPPATEPTSGEEPEMTVNAEEPASTRRFAMPEDEGYPSDESVQAFLASGPTEEAPAPDLFDRETGLRNALAWEEAVGHEDARRARYGHQVTVVVAELDRLDSLARELGRENADRLIRPVAQALLVNGRASDIVARLGHHRFGVLLPETDEVRAINYVERIRLACDAWLDAAAVSIRLSIGWAGVPTGGTLADAFATAERRMYADRGTSRPTGGPAGTRYDAAAPSEPTPVLPNQPVASPPVAAPPVEGSPAEPPAPYPGWVDPTPEFGAG